MLQREKFKFGGGLNKIFTNVALQRCKIIIASPFFILNKLHIENNHSPCEYSDDIKNNRDIEQHKIRQLCVANVK